jgi:signal transduction histidine kinase
MGSSDIEEYIPGISKVKLEKHYSGGMAGSSRSGQTRTAKRLMTLVWVSFTLVYVVFFYYFNDTKEIAEGSLDGYLEVLLLGIPTIVVLGGSMWLSDTRTEEDLHSRLFGFTVGAGALFVLATHTALLVAEAAFDPGERVLMLLMSTGFGASCGTVMGILDIRSKHRERERVRAREESKRHERKRSRLEHLNYYLRHEVLNEAQKINGFATLLADRTDISGERKDYLDTIRHSSEEIAIFVQSIREVLEASDHNPDREPQDVVTILETEAEKIQKTNADADIRMTDAGPTPVLAGALLSRVFRNLIENAIEHNQGPVSVTLSVEETRQWVEVLVRDDGSGIPPAKRDSLFEPPDSGDHGGLFLIKNLVQVYGGGIELIETGSDGTVFLVRLAAPE